MKNQSNILSEEARSHGKHGKHRFFLSPAEIKEIKKRRRDEITETYKQLDAAFFPLFPLFLRDIIIIR